MKNKKLMFVLLPVVVVVWGVIIYRVVNAMMDDEPTVLETISVSNRIQKEVIRYELALNYSDPFLGPSRVVSRPKKSTKKVSKPRKRTVKQATVKRPIIRYNGRIENTSSNEARHLISVDGQSHIVTLEQDIAGVVLKKVFTDSVQFKWNK